MQNFACESLMALFRFCFSPFLWFHLKLKTFAPNTMKSLLQITRTEMLHFATSIKVSRANNPTLLCRIRRYICANAIKWNKLKCNSSRDMPRICQLQLIPQQPRERARHQQKRQNRLFHQPRICYDCVVLFRYAVDARAAHSSFNTGIAHVRCRALFIMEFWCARKASHNNSSSSVCTVIFRPENANAKIERFALLLLLCCRCC